MIFSVSQLTAARKVARVNPLATWDRLVARLHGPTLPSTSRSSPRSAAPDDGDGQLMPLAGCCRNAHLEADLERLVEELERESFRLLNQLDRALDAAVLD